jgi:hypothetical protein
MVKVAKRRPVITRWEQPEVAISVVHIIQGGAP